MSNNNPKDKVLDVRQIVDIAQEAGASIMEIYNAENFEVEFKDDKSPLTVADTRASSIIERRLKQIFPYTVISEENEIREAGDCYWLVDPLDGTKEFIKRNDEFTVNIALIECGQPVMGVVYAPALGVTYYASEASAWKVDENGTRIPVVSNTMGRVPIIVTSKSHKDERTQKLLDAIDEYDEISMGSSLKLCLVAEGSADLYPRLAPTYLWDTAAAHAIVLAAGGRVTDTRGNDIEYFPDLEIKNPYFIVTSANCKVEWQSLISY